MCYPTYNFIGRLDNVATYRVVSVFFTMCQNTPESVISRGKWVPPTAPSAGQIMHPKFQMFTRVGRREGASPPAPTNSTTHLPCCCNSMPLPRSLCVCVPACGSVFFIGLLLPFFWSRRIQIKGQGRINRCAGCTMGGPPPGAPGQLPKIFPRCFDVWTFSVRLKGRQLFRGRKCTAREAPPPRKSWLWEKGPALRWHGAPEWLTRPCQKQLPYSMAYSHVCRV